MLSRRCFLTSAAAAMIAGRTSAAAAYTFAVVPQFDQRRLFAIWKPVVAAVQERAGIRLKLVATLTVPEFERDFARGVFDFAYLSPLQLYLESRRQGYQALVRDDEPLRGVVAVRKESPLVSISQMAGRKLAVPSLNAVGPLVARQDIRQAAGAEAAVVNARTHTAVYAMVAAGQVDAGAGAEKTLRLAQEGGAELRVIHRTRALPSHPIAAHPRVPEADRAAVRQAILSLAAEPSGRALLAAVPFDRVVPAANSDYDMLAELGLASLWVDARD